MFISKTYILEIYRIGIFTFYFHHPTYFPLQILSLQDFDGGFQLFVRANWATQLQGYAGQNGSGWVDLH